MPKPHLKNPIALFYADVYSKIILLGVTDVQPAASNSFDCLFSLFIFGMESL